MTLITCEDWEDHTDLEWFNDKAYMINLLVNLGRFCGLDVDPSTVLSQKEEIYEQFRNTGFLRIGNFIKGKPSFSLKMYLSKEQLETLENLVGCICGHPSVTNHEIISPIDDRGVFLAIGCNCIEHFQLETKCLLCNTNLKNMNTGYCVGCKQKIKTSQKELELSEHNQRNSIFFEFFKTHNNNDQFGLAYRFTNPLNVPTTIVFTRASLFLEVMAVV